jgi:hypothetical protein
VTVAGTTAIVVGAAATAVGLMATPALAETPLMYHCMGTTNTGQQPVDFDLSLTVAGSVTGTPQVGDPVELTGFMVTAKTAVSTLPGLGVTHVSGAFSSFPIGAVAGDTTGAGSADPSTDGGMPIEADVTADGAIEFTTPASALTLTGFTANAAGSMNFSVGTVTADLTLTGVDSDTQEPVTVDTVSVTCDGVGQFATVDVPEPADTGNNPPPTDTNPQGGDDNNNGDNGDNGNHQTASNPAHTTPAAVRTTPATVVRNVSARGTLANTGAPYTVPMTATGAALVLLGAGLLVTGRRRRVVPEGMTEQD